MEKCNKKDRSKPPVGDLTCHLVEQRRA